MMESIARKAGQRLAGELDPNLPAAVEAQLQGKQTPKRFEPVTIAISLAALLVSAAKAAWDIYRDVKEDNKPAPAVVERRLRLELPPDQNLTPEQRNRIIAVVVEEVASATSKP